MSLEQVTVPVPSDRLSDFYRWFAEWIEGTDSALSAAAPATVQPASAHDRATDTHAAAAWWRMLKPAQRALWTLWIEASPGLVSAPDIMESLGLNSPSVIPGLLSWAKRNGEKVGFTATWHFRYDHDGTPLYGIDDLAYATVLREARTLAESSTNSTAREESN